VSTAICLMKSAYFLIRCLVRSGDARDYRFRTPVLLQLILYPFALMLAARSCSVVVDARCQRF
jgi:hypothetical protein